MSDHERLHERLMNGTADPGMYPDHWYECMGMGEQQREPEPSSDDICAMQGHAYHGDDGDRGRCYCGEVLYAVGGGPLSSADHERKEDAMSDETGTTRPSTGESAPETQVDKTPGERVTTEKIGDADSGDTRENSGDRESA